MYGLGEYPGAVCFDQTRWSFLPYWYDTTPELLCKAKFVTTGREPVGLTMPVPMPTGAAVVPGATQPDLFTGDPQSIINSAIDPSAAQDRSNIKNFFASVNSALQIDPSAGAPAGPGTDYTTVALVIAGAAALIFIGGR